jgi:hypothetical protein
VDIWTEAIDLIVAHPFYSVAAFIFALCCIGSGTRILRSVVFVAGLAIVYVAARHFLAEVDAVFAPVREVLAR